MVSVNNRSLSTLGWKNPNHMDECQHDRSHCQTVGYPERVSFYEKFQKTFFEGDVSLSTNNSIPVLNLKICKSFDGTSSHQFQSRSMETISHPKYYILTPKSNKLRFRPTFFLIPITFCSNNVLWSRALNSLTVKYLNHQN